MYFSDQPFEWSMEIPEKNSMLPVKYYLQIQELQRQLVISECLGILISQSTKIDMTLLRELENRGVSLGNGAFVLLRIDFPELFFPFMGTIEDVPISDRDKRPNQQKAMDLHMYIQETLTGLCKTLFFSFGGKMYVLLCMQGESSNDPEDYIAFFIALKSSAIKIENYAKAKDIHIKFYVSNVHLTVRGITAAYQETCMLEEYASFLPIPENPLLLWEYRNHRETDDNRKDKETALLSQIALALRMGASNSLDLCAQNTAVILVGDKPVPRILVQQRASQFLRSLGQALLEGTVVDASFLQQYDFQWLGERCTDRQTLTDTIRMFLLEAQNCCRQLSTLLTTDMLLKVQQYIQDNLKNLNLSVTTIADHFHVSRTTLSARFQRFFGVSMARYIQELRISLAKQLLRDMPTLTLEEVAIQSGFSAVSTMYRVFMRMEGSSPGSFRGK